MASPKPDEFGWYRVEQDTGTKFSIRRAPLKGEKVLDEPASDEDGAALPPEYPKAVAKAVEAAQKD